MANATPNIPPAKLKAYEKMVATIADVERKGAAFPYTSLNGNMFTYFGNGGSLALRLGKDEREKFLKKYKTGLYVSYGATMKEYVTVPDALLKDAKTLKKYFKLSYEYAATLKSKPTKKKK